jgi:A/G-specific adenine glycosylase
VRSPEALAAHARATLPSGQAAAFNQAMMELGATTCRPRVPRCGDCPVRHGCAGGETSRRRAPAHRFEDTDRWARGRVVAALLEGNQPPREALAGERGERVLAGLERDGLISRAADGAPQLPA